MSEQGSVHNLCDGEAEVLVAVVVGVLSAVGGIMRRADTEGDASTFWVRRSALVLLPNTNASFLIFLRKR